MKLEFLDYAISWVIIGSILIPAAVLLQKLLGQKIFKRLGLLPDEEESE